MFISATSSLCANSSRHHPSSIKVPDPEKLKHLSCKLPNYLDPILWVHNIRRSWPLRSIAALVVYHPLSPNRTSSATASWSLASNSSFRRDRMDYAQAGYYARPVQQYPYFGVSSRTGQSYTPQDEHTADPIVNFPVNPRRRDANPMTRLTPAQDAFHDPNGFVAFEQSFNFAPQSMIPAPQSPPHSIHRNSMSQAIPGETSLDIQADFEIYEPGQGRSSDDEKDNLTPAQSRRKAQNRAAYVRLPSYCPGSCKIADRNV